MGLTIAQKIIKEHLVGGEMVAGNEISLKIDQTLTQDATGTMAYLEFETMGVPRVRTELSVAYIDHNTLQSGFENADDRNFKMRYVQHECVRVSLEQLRRESWFCSGVIFWMLSDCWPAAAGWTFLDYYIMPKASYYSFKRCSKPVICSIDKCENTYSVYVCNNNLYDIDAKTEIFAVDKAGNQKHIATVDSNVPKQSSQAVYNFEYEGCGIIIAQNQYDRASYKNGDLAVTKTDIEYTINGDSVTFKSKGYIHAVEIDGNVAVSDNYFSMLPGEEKTVELKNESNEQREINICAYTIGE